MKIGKEKAYFFLHNSTTIEGRPQLLVRTLELEEIEKDVQHRRYSELRTKGNESSDEGPTVRMQLGRGDVQLSQKLFFKNGQRETKVQFFKDSVIEKTK